MFLVLLVYWSDSDDERMNVHQATFLVLLLGENGLMSYFSCLLHLCVSGLHSVRIQRELSGIEPS